jgi:hypothetical protein
MPKRLQILNENDCCIIFNTTKRRTDKERTVFIRDDLNVVIIDKYTNSVEDILTALNNPPLSEAELGRIERALIRAKTSTVGLWVIGTLYYLRKLFRFIRKILKNTFFKTSRAT